MRISLFLGVLAASALSLIHIRVLRPESPDPTKPIGTIPANIRRTLTFGYRAAGADLAWLDAIQYYGNASNRTERFRELGNILDIVTDLDPHFEYAFQFAGETVPYHEPDGERRWFNTKRAIELLRKGVANSPRRWEIPWLLSYNLYTYWGSYREAGEMMLRAAELADHGRRSDERFAPPTYLRSLAVRLLAQGGSLQVAIDTTQLAMTQATDEQSHAEYQARFQALVLEQELQAASALAETRLNSGAPAGSFEELVRGSNLADLRQDPYGDDFFLDPEGHVRSPNQDKLLRLHIHPGEPAIEHAVD